MKPDAQFKLSVMMFFQFFAWGAWFATLAMPRANGLADFGGGAYGSAPIGAIFAPCFLVNCRPFLSLPTGDGGVVSDRGVLLLLVPGVAESGNGETMVWMMTANMLCYMPTLGLGNSIAFANLDRLAFPKVRVWGRLVDRCRSLGWVPWVGLQF